MDDKSNLYAICISALLLGSVGMWVSFASIVRFTVAVGTQGPSRRYKFLLV